MAFYTSQLRKIVTWAHVVAHVEAEISRNFPSSLGRRENSRPLSKHQSAPPKKNIFQMMGGFLFLAFLPEECLMSVCKSLECIRLLLQFRRSFHEWVRSTKVRHTDEKRRAPACRFSVLFLGVLAPTLVFALCHHMMEWQTGRGILWNSEVSLCRSSTKINIDSD